MLTDLRTTIALRRLIEICRLELRDNPRGRLMLVWSDATQLLDAAERSLTLEAGLPLVSAVLAKHCHCQCGCESCEECELRAWWSEQAAKEELENALAAQRIREIGITDADLAELAKDSSPPKELFDNE